MLLLTNLTKIHLTCGSEGWNLEERKVKDHRSLEFTNCGFFGCHIKKIYVILIRQKTN
jgi:hypothetical protein